MSSPRAARTRSGCWPIREQELLLRAALLAADAAEPALREWETAVAFDRLDPASVRLLPLLYDNLIRCGLSSPVLPRIKGVHRHAWCRNQVLFARIAETIDALENAGIRTMLLKGV